MAQILPNLNTGSFDTTHFSLLGADKRPDDLTLATDTIDIARSIETDTHKQRNAIVCDCVGLVPQWPSLSSGLMLHSGVTAIAWG